MEFAFLNAVMTSETMPPRDPWLSGYNISYYYFGYVMMGMVATMTGVQASVAFNLAVALAFGLAATGSFGLALNLISLTSSSRSSVVSEPRSGVGRLGLSALMAPVLAVMCGNLGGILEVLHQRGLGSEKFWVWLDVKHLDTAPIAGATWMPERYLWWWQSSRVISDINLKGIRIDLQPIDEFPFFSFLLGDLHPHLLAIPFVFVSLSVALQMFLAGRVGDEEVSGEAWYRLRLGGRTGHVILYGLVFGALAFVNAWDFPIYAAIAVASFAVGEGWRLNWTRDVWPRSLFFGVILVVVALLLYMPYYAGFRSQANGILPNPIFATRLNQFLIMFGPVITLVIGWLVWIAGCSWRASNWRTATVMGPFMLVMLAAMCAGLAGLIYMRGDAALLSESLRQVGAHEWNDVLTLIMRRRMLEAPGTPILLGAVLFLVGARLGARGNMLDDKGKGVDNDCAVRFVLILVGFGALLTVFPEFLYLRDGFGVRLNTVFKFYYQAWMLWAVAAAVGVWQLMTYGRRWVRVVTAIATGLMVTIGMVYTCLAIWTKTDGLRGTTRVDGVQVRTLDGMAYMAEINPDEYGAIQWLRRNGAYDAVVSEAVGGSYTGYGRVSAYTGMATVLGWPGHEGQWRGGYAEAAGREDDMARLYATDSWPECVELMDRYGVEYVFFGDLEHAAAGAAGWDKFEEHMTSVYSEGNVQIFRRP